MTAARADAFEACRGRLFAVAYGMLGDVGEAEDTVQDAWLRWQAADVDAVRNAEAFLVTVVTRLAIDRLRSARARRELYVGPWLPEPLVTAAGDQPEEAVAEAEQLSLALLATLERLNPVERAVFLLREVFDLEYAAIADVVERSPATCRQIARRARDRAGEPRRRHRPSPDEEQALTAAFAEALVTGSLERLTAVLAADAVLWSDGGGVVRAARKPVVGGPKIALFLTRIRRWSPEGAHGGFARVNGEPGLQAFDADGRPIWVLAIEIADGLVSGLRIVNNPDKLVRVGPNPPHGAEGTAAPAEAQPPPTS